VGVGVGVGVFLKFCPTSRIPPLRPYLRIISNLAEGGVGGVGEAFRAQARVQKETGKALGSVIAEGDFRRAFPDSFKRGVV